MTDTADPTTPAGFVATSRKAFIAAGAAFLAVEGPLIPGLVTNFSTGLIFADLGIGIGAAAIAFAGVWGVKNAPSAS